MRFGVFYSKIIADRTLEKGYLQIVYSSELGLVGTEEIAGTRLVMCLNNHYLTVDFPPALAAFRLDLGDSCSAQFWPTRQPVGIAELRIGGPRTIDRVLLAICRSINVQLNAADLRC